MATSICPTSCKDSEGGEVDNSAMEDIDDRDALGGFLDTLSPVLCHLPGQYCIVKVYWRVFSFNFKICGFIIVYKSLFLKIGGKGLWSVITIKSWQPRTNILTLFRPHATARASPSVDEYHFSVGLMSLDPANVNCHPLGQQVSAFAVLHWQYCCKTTYLIPC